VRDEDEAAVSKARPPTAATAGRLVGVGGSQAGQARRQLQSSKQRPVMPSSSRGRSLAGLCVEKATLGYSQHAGGERVGMEKLLAAAFGLQYGSSAERALAATRVASLATERKGG